MVQHRDIPAAEIHRLVNWEFATQADRQNATVTATDVFKLAYQQSNGQFYMLLNTTPTWLQILSEGSTASPTGVPATDAPSVSPSRLPSVPPTGMFYFELSIALIHLNR